MGPEATATAFEHTATAEIKTQYVRQPDRIGNELNFNSFLLRCSVIISYTQIIFNLLL